MKETEKTEPKQGHSIYLGDLYPEIVEEAKRLDRSASWLIRMAWQLAKPLINKMSKGRT